MMTYGGEDRQYDCRNVKSVVKITLAIFLAALVVLLIYFVMFFVIGMDVERKWVVRNKDLDKVMGLGKDVGLGKFV